MEEKEIVNVEGNEIVTIEGNEIVNVEENEIVNVGGKEIVNVEGKEIVKVEGKEIVNVEGKEIVNVEGKEIVNVEGKETVNSEGKEIVNVEGKETVNSEGKKIVNFEGKEVLNYKGKEFLNINKNWMRKFPRKPFKILDYNQTKRIGIVVSDLDELIRRAHEKLEIPAETPVRVALEEDGTEVDDEDYFSTLESNTALVILVGDEIWPPSSSDINSAWDEPDREDKPPPPHLVKLVDELYSDLSCITLLGGKELEMLSDMDTDLLADIVPAEDRAFLGNLKEASFRILTEKDQAKEAMELLKLYHARHMADRMKQVKQE